MPRLITMPTSPNFVSSSFRLVRTVGTTVSPYSGSYKTQDFDNVYWEADVRLPPMKRSQAVEWQAFFLQLKGPTNYFKFADPDALSNTGTYDTSYLVSDPRINDTSETLSFSGSTVTATTSGTFDNIIVGDFIHITGALNPENNGTFKITTKTSGTVVVTDGVFTTESNTASCKIRQNIKGAEALSLEGSTNTASGTIKKGDYLQIQGTTNTTGNPVQYVQAVEDATETSQSGSPNHFSVRIEPKLRADFADGDYAVFTSPKGLFRLNTNVVEWSADNVSNYGFSFSCSEVI